MPEAEGAAGAAKKQMLVLHGGRDFGKSTSLRLAYESVLRRTVSASAKANSTVKCDYLYFTKREVGVSIFGDVKFGLLTRGDSAKHVRDGLDFLKKQGCTVVVCATRSIGTEPWKAAVDFANRNGFGVPKAIEKLQARSIALEAGENAAVAKKVISWACKRLGV